MSDMDADYQKAVKESSQLKTKPTDDELLNLYGLYKQALQDPKFEDAPAPGTFDFKGKAKYRAWKTVVDQNTTPEDAKQKYVELVNQLKEKYGLKEESSTQ